MKELMDILEKNKENKLSPDKAKSKMNVLRELRNSMNDIMSKDIPSKKMQAVTVAAPTEEGVQEGLDVAQEILPGDEDSSEEMPEGDLKAEEAIKMLSPEEKMKLKALLA